jgi:hypothetical protein
MELLSHLWLPILLSAAAVWIASAIAWMFMPHHKNDWSKLPDEKRFMNEVRSMSIPPGNYGFPHFECHKDAQTPEAKKMWEEGPAGWITIMKKPSMGRNMILSFLVYLAVSVLLGYIGSETLARGTNFARVFQILGTGGILAYCFAFMPSDIWFSKKPSAIVMCLIDGVVYGLITGAIFAALWPKA